MSQLVCDISILGDGDIDEITACAIGNTQGGLVLISFSIYSDEIHIGQDGTLEVFLGQKRFEIRFLHVSAKKPVLPFVNTDVDNVVVVDVIHFQAFFGNFRMDNLDVCRIDIGISTITGIAGSPSIVNVSRP